MVHKPKKKSRKPLGAVGDLYDREETQKFLGALDPDATEFTFQTFDDNKDRGDRSLARTLHGTLDEHWDTLKRLSSRGAGIFITVQETDLRGRKEKNIIRVRALLADLDGAPLAPVKSFHSAPHIIVESSDGKWHVYWRVIDFDRLNYTGTQRAIATKFDSDQQVIDLPRVMRLPGFPHQKVEDGVVSPPFMAHVVSIKNHQPYEDIDFGVPIEARSPRQSQSSAFNNTREPLTQEKILAAIAAIPNGVGTDRTQWTRIGLAIHRELGETEIAYNAFDAYSQRWPGKDGIGYSETATRKKWREICSSPGDRVTAGTLLWEADHADPEWRRRYDAEEAGIESPVTQFTDLGNCKQLVHRHGENLRYVHSWKSWLTWEEGHWWRDDDGSVVRNAKATVEAMFNESRLIQDEDARKIARKHALSSQSANKLASMVSLAETELPVVLPVARIDEDPMLVGVVNGVINLQTGEFRPAERSDYVTKRMNVEYDPRARCPEFKKFLRRILPTEMLPYLQRAMGYLLTGKTTEEVIFIMWGDGANGKSTLRETMFYLMGDYAMSSDANLLITQKNGGGGATPDVARLHGKRMVAINETASNDILNEQRVKFITGSDVITARNLYEAPFDFIPTHKAIVTTQHKPIIRGTDEGIWRRIHLWPFLYTFPVEDRNPNFRMDVLIPELPGILNWALEGVEMFLSEGLNPPEMILAATNEYRSDMDIVGRWMEERCERDGQARMKTSELYEDYKLWAEREIGFWVSVVVFGRMLSSRGLQPVSVDRGRGFQGLKLRPFSAPGATPGNVFHLNPRSGR